MGWGRRGDALLMVDLIASVLFLVGFMLLAFLYIDANANSDLYFSKVYAYDVGTLAQIAAGAPGDILLRHDNFRTETDLVFDSQNGLLRVGTPSSKTEEVIDGRFIALPNDPLRYVERAREPYGTIEPGSDFHPTTIRHPSSLMIRKAGTQFAITDAATLLEGCKVPRARLADTLVLQLTFDGLTLQEQDKVRNAIRDTLGDVFTGTPTVNITLTRATGTPNAIAFSPTGEDGAAIACFFHEHLETLSVNEFGTFTTPAAIPQQTVELAITVTADNNARVTPDNLGKAIAFSLARYLR